MWPGDIICCATLFERKDGPKCDLTTADEFQRKTRARLSAGLPAVGCSSLCSRCGAATSYRGILIKADWDARIEAYASSSEFDDQKTVYLVGALMLLAVILVPKIPSRWRGPVQVSHLSRSRWAPGRAIVFTSQAALRFPGWVVGDEDDLQPGAGFV